MVPSHSNTYTKMVHKTNRKITVSVFVVGESGAHKREIIYLPVENGGLGLLEPNLQQKALRLRFLQNIVNPLCKTKWVILARYWIWVPIGTYKYSMEIFR